MQSSHNLRTNCPFYGFAEIYGWFRDSRGNECALVEGHTPCRMEMEGKKPVWYNCPASTEQSFSDFEKSLAGLRIFPNELWPLGEAKWEGISLKAWYDYITLGKPLFSELPDHINS
jgi:hypothetical protein